MGVVVAAYAGGRPSSDQALIVGPGGGQTCAASGPAIGEWLKAGGRLLAIGLDGAELNTFLPGTTTKKTEHIAAWFETPTSPLLRGIGPADVHNRDPRDLPLVTGGATIVGDGVLAAVDDGVALCQLAPWTFDYSRQYNLKRTYRRASCLVARLLANLGVTTPTPVLDRIRAPVDPAKAEKRWLDGLYLDAPEADDDPYRFFGW